MASNNTIMTTSLKLVFGDDTRRVQLPDAAYESLVEATRRVYPEVVGPTKFTFLDDEGDTINISSTAELNEAFNVAAAQGKSLKVTVTEDTKAKKLSKKAKAVEEKATGDDKAMKTAEKEAKKEVKALLQAQKLQAKTDKNASKMAAKAVKLQAKAEKAAASGDEAKALKIAAKLKHKQEKMAAKAGNSGANADADAEPGSGQIDEFDMLEDVSPLASAFEAPTREALLAALAQLFADPEACAKMRAGLASLFAAVDNKTLFTGLRPSEQVLAVVRESRLLETEKAQLVAFAPHLCFKLDKMTRRLLKGGHRGGSHERGGHQGGRWGHGGRHGHAWGGHQGHHGGRLREKLQALHDSLEETAHLLATHPKLSRCFEFAYQQMLQAAQPQPDRCCAVCAKVVVPARGPGSAFKAESATSDDEEHEESELLVDKDAKEANFEAMFECSVCEELCLCVPCEATGAHPKDHPLIKHGVPPPAPAVFRSPPVGGPPPGFGGPFGHPHGAHLFGGPPPPFGGPPPPFGGPGFGFGAGMSPPGVPPLGMGWGMGWGGPRGGPPHGHRGGRWHGGRHGGCQQQ